MSKPKMDWYQTADFIVITILIKNVQKESVNIQFASNSLSVSIHNDDSNTFSLEYDLAHEIIAEESSFALLPTKVEIKLKKSVQIQWKGLEEEPNEIKPTYPSSSKKAKNWDKVEVEEEEPQGEAALNALFQKIYKDANDETRKAMVKSFTESNGTALSTNWKEVGAKKMETKAPEGMDVKNWES